MSAYFDKREVESMSYKLFSYNHRRGRMTNIKNVDDADIRIHKDNPRRYQDPTQDILDEWCRMLKMGEISVDELDMLMDEVIDRLR